MRFLINFLLISGVFLIIVETTPINVASEIWKLFTNGLPTVTVANNLKLVRGGGIAATEKSLVWRGIYNNKTNVACKIILEKDRMHQEMEAFMALNATMDPNIEKHDIPRIHYYGQILDKYGVIAMTLFDETLYHRYLVEYQSLSDLSILMIFKQAVQGLQYLNQMNVVHNDIKPQNIFLRGPDVFLGDFDVASINGIQSDGFSRLYGSSDFYKGLPRTSKSDLESLVYSIWSIANVPMNLTNKANPEGYILSLLDRKAAESRMLEKCKHFKNKHVYEAMKFICTEEVISSKTVPDYDRIIDILTEAISKIKGNSDPPKFEWLTNRGI